MLYFQLAVSIFNWLFLFSIGCFYFQFSVLFSIAIFFQLNVLFSIDSFYFQSPVVFEWLFWLSIACCFQLSLIVLDWLSSNGWIYYRAISLAYLFAWVYSQYLTVETKPSFSEGISIALSLGNFNVNILFLTMSCINHDFLRNSSVFLTKYFNTIYFPKKTIVYLLLYVIKYCLSNSMVRSELPFL